MHWLGGLQAAIGSGAHIGAAQMARTADKARKRDNRTGADFVPQATLFETAA